MKESDRIADAISLRLGQIADVSSIAHLGEERDAARRLTELLVWIPAEKLREVLEGDCKEVALCIVIPDRWPAEPETYPIQLEPRKKH